MKQRAALVAGLLGTVFLTGGLVRAQVKERQDLESARAAYRQAVKTRGPQSPEAMNARNKVRQARRSYHDAIRQSRNAAQEKPSVPRRRTR